MAAVFSSDFNTTILKVGLFTYAGYLILFPLFLSMINRWQVYQTTIRQFQKQIDEFQRSLPASIVDQLVEASEFDNNRKRFIGWFIVSILIYIVFIVLLIVGALSISKFVP